MKVLPKGMHGNVNLGVLSWRHCLAIKAINKCRHRET